MRRNSWFWAIVTMLVGACLNAPGARAESFSAAQRLRTCVARDTGQRVADMLSAQARFDCRSPERAFGPGDYWVRTVALPAGTGTTLTVLRSRWEWQRNLQLFVAFRDGSVAAMRPETPRMSAGQGLRYAVALPRGGRDATVLLWRIVGAANTRRILPDAHLVSPDQSARHEVRTIVPLAGFVGAGFALLVYNLALWVALRRRFQLAYCGLAASLLLHALLAGDVLAGSLPAIDRNAWIAASYGTLSASFAAALWFTRAFFGARLPAWLHRGCAAIGWTMLASAAAMFVVPLDRLRIVDLVQGVLAAAMLVATVPLMIQARRQGAAFFAMVALAWAGPAILAAMRVLNTFQILPFLVALREWTAILLAAQALACSLAVAWRIHRLARERDEARAQEVAARLLADTDPLTGLLNRRAFLDRAIGRRGPQLLLLADLDHFKAINETIGHDGGDEVLRGFARALVQALPPGALAARIGGEEFAVVADADDRLTPRLVTDALRQVRTPFDLAVTTSIGSCTGPLLDETHWTALYRLADKALFAAKAAGRDRVRDAASLPGGGLTLAA